MSDGFKHTRMQPAASLLIHGGPRREIVWQITPLNPGADDITNCVEQIAEAIDPLRGLFGQQCEVRRQEIPLFVGHIAGAC